MLLQGQVILITGSTTGIGAAIARRCVREGAKVMIHGRDERRAEQMCAELGHGVCAYVTQALEETHHCAQVVEATVSRFGVLTGLVNNAGISPRSNIDTSTDDFFNRVMAINVKAPLFLSQAAVRQFRKQGQGGRIVNIGSINAYCGQPDLLVYSMSKGALMTMTRNLADSLGPENICVNQLNVGWTPTEAEIALKKAEGLSDDWQLKVPKVYAPTGRLQTPEVVANHVLFWLSELAGATNGAVYEVEQYPVIGRNRISDIDL